jgi:hypothetical protein
MSRDVLELLSPARVVHPKRFGTPRRWNAIKA